MEVNVLREKKGLDFKRLWTSNQRQKICFIFPGNNYSVDMPLLYYSTKLLMDNEFEVVHTNYSYGSEIGTYDELKQKMVEDISPILLEILQEKLYEEILLLGKSIGTVPIVEEFTLMEELKNSKVVLLTPLLNYESFTEKLMNTGQKSLIVIGNRDYHYEQDKIKMFKENILKTEMTIIDGANHSLEIESGSTFKNLEILLFVLKQIEKLITL